jgi:uncharacterized phosphosugar-binding protein
VSQPGRTRGIDYLRILSGLLDRLRKEEWPHLREAAELVADALAAGHTIHAFGTGHSHMLAEELAHRAGGLVRVRPIIDERLTVHADPARSTDLERQPGIADELFARHGLEAGDVLIVASNSGGNAAPSRFAQLARDAGLSVIAITSLQHATAADARSTELPRLHELADVVIDNGGIPGDAAIDIHGFERRVGPTSTVVGAAAVNAIVVEAIDILVARGISPDVYVSGNLQRGDAANAGFDDIHRSS